MTIEEAIKITRETDNYNITQVIEAAEVIATHIRKGYTLINLDDLIEELEEYKEQTSEDVKGKDSCELCDLMYWDSVMRIVKGYA